MCFVNLTLSVDEETLARARNKAAALGKSLNQLISDYLYTLAGSDGSEESIKALKKALRNSGASRGRATRAVGTSIAKKSMSALSFIR